MNLAVLVLSALLLFQGADEQKMRDLVRDLGADEYSVRDRAEADLRTLGDSAIPALREAVEDKDPERALRARRILEDLNKRKQQGRSRTWMTYRDLGRGFTFETHPDGKVELTLKEPGKKEPRTYRADSLDDFKRKYPDLASKYDVENLGPKEKWTFFDESKNAWEAWRKRFDEDECWNLQPFGWIVPPWFPFGSESLDSWMKERRKELEKVPKIGPPPAEGTRKDESGKPQLGITIERVGNALADQLGLRSDEGLVISEVNPTSTAERAGLRKHDILLKVNGKALTSPEQLRRDVQEGLNKGMELEILRRGKREALRIDPSANK